MEDKQSSSSLKQADVWWIVITVIVITLFNIFALTVIFWKPLCAKIVATGLEYGAKQLVTAWLSGQAALPKGRQATSYQQPASEQGRRADQLEEFKTSAEQAQPTRYFHDMTPAERKAYIEKEMLAIKKRADEVGKALQEAQKPLFNQE